MLQYDTNYGVLWYLPFELNDYTTYTSAAFGWEENHPRLRDIHSISRLLRFVNGKLWIDGDTSYLMVMCP